MLWWIILALFIYVVFTTSISSMVENYPFGIKLVHFFISDMFAAMLLLFWFVRQYPDTYAFIFK